MKPVEGVDPEHLIQSQQETVQRQVAYLDGSEMHVIRVNEEGINDVTYIDEDGVPCEKGESNVQTFYSQRDCLDENGMLAAKS